VYPNGSADINHFHAAGGLQFLIGTLLDAGYLQEDVRTVAGNGLHRYRQEPILDGEKLMWRDVPTRSLDEDVLRPASRPFAADGGLRMVAGNLGRAVIKVSAVAAEHRVVEAPARVFTTQAGFEMAFAAGELERDVVVVIRHQGPQANGMPELHGLTPALGVLMDRGFQVALLTDGRMSGASGKIPAAIQLTPEAAAGGPLARIADGDVVRLDANAGTLDVLVGKNELSQRELVDGPPDEASWTGTGRELFGALRRSVGPADHGASVFGPLTPEHFGTPLAHF
jgi:phosphogluconate dehydratase